MRIIRLERNTPARRCWQAVVAEYTGDQYANLDAGTQQQFRN